MGNTTTKTVVLDWDGTLACSFHHRDLLAATSELRLTTAIEPDAMVDTDMNGLPVSTAVVLRPGARDMIGTLSDDYNVVIWSFGVDDYVRPAVDQIGVTGLLKQIVTREESADGLVPKDLYARFGNLEHVVIVDDMNHVFGVLNPDNAVHIRTWNALAPLAFEDAELHKVPELAQRRFEFLKGRNEELIRKRQGIISRMQRGRLSGTKTS